MIDFYSQIFKRKSFHNFKETGNLSEEDLAQLKEFMASVTPLDPSIRTKTIIVPERETSFERGAEYCILFYSEKKGEYLRNIGYIGQQIDLYLASRNIGSLWLGLASPEEMHLDDLDFVIMIAIAKVAETAFRKDMFKAKRKPIEEIWKGDTLGVAEIARFAPSACNSQPWITENNGEELTVYRYSEPGQHGFVPAVLEGYYNHIDIGIYLFILETCLEHEGFVWERTLFDDDKTEKALTAKYRIKKVR